MGTRGFVYVKDQGKIYALFRAFDAYPEVSFVDLKKWVEGDILPSSFVDPEGYYSSWMDYEYMVDLDKKSVKYFYCHKVSPIMLSESKGIVTDRRDMPDELYDKHMQFILDVWDLIFVLGNDYEAASTA